MPMEDSQTEEVLTDDLLFQAITDNIAATTQIEPSDGASAMPRGRGSGRRPRGLEDVGVHKKVVVTAL